MPIEPESGSARRLVDISPSDALHRHALTRRGMAVEIVQAGLGQRLELRYRGPRHLLILRSRHPRSSPKFTFVPADQDFRDTLEPNEPTHLMLFYLESVRMPAGGDGSRWPVGAFEDAALLDTARKLARLLDDCDAVDERYFDALFQVLCLELARLADRRPIRGGLAPWQQRAVAAHIEQNLAEAISLATLAGLARLSRHHFCRAFRQTFGMPPHRYHKGRRIERAKVLLSTPACSVTEIGTSVGFRETSAFSATFHKITGMTPSAYRRGLGRDPAAQFAVMPPSITSSLPVTQDASSDAR